MAKSEPSGTLLRFKEEAITSALGRRCLGVVTLESMHGTEGWWKLATWNRNGTPTMCLATEASQLSSELDRHSCFVWGHGPNLRDRHTCLLAPLLLGNPK